VQTRYRILSDDDIAVAQNMYEEGQSLALIGEHFGVTDPEAELMPPAQLHCHR